MKKLAWILVLLGLLAGCSARTRYAVLVNVQSFLGENSEGEATLSTDLQLPPDEGGYPVELPGQVADLLEVLEIDLTAAIENQGSDTLSLVAGLYLAPANETNIYQDSYVIESTELELPPGETGELQFQLSYAEGDPAYRTVKEGEGRFRVGLRLSGSGQKFRYRIETFTLYLRAKPLGELFQSN